MPSSASIARLWMKTGKISPFLIWSRHCGRRSATSIPLPAPVRHGRFLTTRIPKRMKAGQKPGTSIPLSIRERSILLTRSSISQPSKKILPVTTHRISACSSATGCFNLHPGTSFHQAVLGHTPAVPASTLSLASPSPPVISGGNRQSNHNSDLLMPNILCTRSQDSCMFSIHMDSIE